MVDSLDITSTDNPRIKQVVKLRKQSQRHKAKQFVVEGFREVKRALEENLACDCLYYCPDILDKTNKQDIYNQINNIRKNSNIDCFKVSKPAFLKMAYRKTPEGILGVFKPPVYSIENLDKAEKNTIFLVVWAIEKPGNLGAMARTASAAGCQALFVIDSVVDAFNPNSIRASTGAVFSLPIITITQAKLLEYFAQNKVKIYPAMVNSSVCYGDIDLATGPTALVIGAEDKGLDSKWKDIAKNSGATSIKIPMRSSTVDSLNASNSAAILLYETRRQMGD